MKLLATLALVLTTLLAPAAKAETFLLHQSGYWSVSYAAFPVGNYCTAVTFDRHDQQFDITVWDNQQIKLYMFLDGYKVPERRVDFSIHIDYEHWDFTNAILNDGMVVFNLPNSQKTADFLLQLHDSSAVALIGTDGSRLATWSLKGSAKALRALIDCAKKL
jgi:hypothetical protein